MVAMSMQSAFAFTLSAGDAGNVQVISLTPAKVSAALFTGGGPILSIDNGDPLFFQPGKPQTLKINVGFDTATYGTDLSKSTGFVKIMNTAGKTIKTLFTWDLSVSGSLPDLSTLTWDGKSIDNTADAQGVCGTSGAVCPNGNYNVFAYVLAPHDATISLEDSRLSAFSIQPDIQVKNLATTLSSFNPYSQTADLSFTLSNAGFVTVEVTELVNSNYVVKNTLIANKSLAAGDYTKTQEPTLSWNGKDSSGNVLPNKQYTIRTSTKQTASGSDIDNQYLPVTINAPTTLSLTTFTSTPTLNGASFDPSTSGNHEILTTAYTLAAPADSVQIEIKDSLNTVMKSFTAGTTEKTTGTSQWDGQYAGHLVEPGTYTVTLTAAKSGEPNLVQSKTITVAYNNSSKPAFDSVAVTPVSFDPDVEDAIIAFRNTKDSDLTVEIRSGTSVIRTFSAYTRDSFNANQTHSISWNGKNDSGSDVSLGAYNVVIIGENAYGVTKEQKTVTVDNSGGSVSSSNAHISDVSFSPSSKFEPAKDGEMTVKFDVDQDLDSLVVDAVRGTKTIELYNETGVSKENNVEVTWDGADDNGDYADAGSWRIMLKSKKGSTSLVASKSIEVAYDKPSISDLYVSKDKIDNDIGEKTNVLFRLKNDAKVDLIVMKGGSEDDTIEEGMDVVKNTWYSVEWDGGSYDYSDTVAIKLVAKNTVNDNVYDSAKVTVDLAEETDSSSKSNVTNDYITPPVTNGNEEMTLSFDLETTADVTVTIMKGKSASGTVISTLLNNVQDMEGGHHDLVWDGKDKNGKTLAKDFYTYKIVSKAPSTETETGMFVVGTVGDVTSSSSSSSSSSSNSGVSPNVTIVTGNGTDTTPNTTTPTTTANDCGGFSDAKAASQYCAAIKWVSENGIFSGYSDGTFKPFQTINRAELLKVVIEAFGLNLEADDGTTLGFKDIEKGAWYMKYIKTAKNKGIFSGDKGKGTARPDAIINRAEALKLIFEAAKASGVTFTTDGSNYSDVKAGVWYEMYASLANKFGLFDGSNLYPENLMSRGEVAQALYRLMK